MSNDGNQRATTRVPTTPNTTLAPPRPYYIRLRLFIVFSLIRSKGAEYTNYRVS